MASQPLQLQTSRQGDGESSGASSNDGGGVLPRDALYEILLRVPAWAAVCRFRTVCQSWRSLLSDPPFIAAHAALHHHRDPLLFAMCGAVAAGGGSGSEVAQIMFLDTSGRVVKRVDAGPSFSLGRIHPHHLGLVLLYLLLEVEFHPLRVLDAATGAVSLLPVYEDDYNSCVFGRAVSSTGGDGDYKVLSLSAATQLCQVLTVDSSGGGSHGTWRAAPRPPVAIKTLHAETVVASGVVYHLVDSSNGWTIAAFDLEAEQWRPDLIQGPVPVPSVGGGDWAVRRSLAEVNNRLAAVSSTDSTMDMWLLMGSGEQARWCKRHRVLTSSIEQRHGLLLDAVPLWVLDDGRVAFWLRKHNYFRRDGTLWMYDPRTQMCVHLADCLSIFGVWCVHRESIISR